MSRAMNTLKSDGVFGRVTMPVGNLYARTQYDCWYDLETDDRKSRFMPMRIIDKIKGPSQTPAIRLRYSVGFFYSHPMGPDLATPSEPILTPHGGPHPYTPRAL